MSNTINAVMIEQKNKKSKNIVKKIKEPKIKEPKIKEKKKVAIKKTVLSWDVGIKNLAYCKTHFNEDLFNIQEWDVIDLCGDANAKKMSTNELIDILLDKLEQMSSKFENVQEILIENQPSLRNPKMKTISMVLMVFFRIKKKNEECIIRFVSPSVKLSFLKERITGVNKNKIYAETKKKAKIYCSLFVSDEERVILNNSKKKDDLCDSFLQSFVVTYGKNLPEKYEKLLELKF